MERQRGRVGGKQVIAWAIALLLFHSIAHPVRGQAAFEVPRDCGTEAEFWANVRQLVGDDAERIRVTELVVKGSSGGVLQLQIVVDGERRQLEHRDCRTLLRSAAVIAGASVRPELQAGIPQEINSDSSSLPRESPAPETHPAPTTRPPTTRPPTTRPPTTRPPTTRPPTTTKRDKPAPLKPNPALRFWIGSSVGATWGIVPSASLDVGAYGGAERGRWGASMATHYVLPRSATNEGRGVTVWAAGGQAMALWYPFPLARVAIGLEVDWLVGKGHTGTEGHRSDSAWLAAPLAEISAIPLHSQRLRIEVAAQGRVNIVRPQFVVDGFGEIYRAPEGGASGQLRAVWQIF